MNTKSLLQMVISIADVNGRIVYSHSVSKQEQFLLEISSFPNGIYSVQLISKKKTGSGKLAVVH